MQIDHSANDSRRAECRGSETAMGHTEGADSATDRVSAFQEASCVYPEYCRMAADSGSRRLSCGWRVWKALGYFVARFVGLYANDPCGLPGGIHPQPEKFH